MTDRRRFLRPVLWTAAILLGGGALFGLVLAAEIPYATTAPLPSPSVTTALRAAPNPNSPTATTVYPAAPVSPWTPTPPASTSDHCGQLGCDPPADHCAPVRIAQTDGEAVSTNTRACDQDWLVVDRTNFYQAPSIRVLYRWTPEGWQAVTSLKTGGCAEILAEEPQFSRALCGKVDAPH